MMAVFVLPREFLMVLHRDLGVVAILEQSRDFEPISISEFVLYVERSREVEWL